MQTVKLNSGGEIAAYWVQEIRGGAGGYLMEVADAPFSMLAGLLEDASAMLWLDDDGTEHKGVYAGIKHMTRDYGRVQIILSKEAAA